MHIATTLASALGDNFSVENTVAAIFICSQYFDNGNLSFRIIRPVDEGTKAAWTAEEVSTSVGLQVAWSHTLDLVERCVTLRVGLAGPRFAEGWGNGVS